MASFETQLPDAAHVTGSRAPQTPIAGIIGGALTGLAAIGDVALKASAEDRKDKAIQGLDAKLFPEVQAYGGQTDPSSPALVGEQTTDPATEAAQGSPGFQSVASGVGKLSQAKAQGRISTAEFMTRSSVIVQQAVADNPRFATEIRQHAQELLGLNPTASMVAIQADEQKSLKDQRTAVKTSFITEAAKSGDVYLNEDGSIDLNLTAQAGQKLAQASANLANVSADVDMQIKRAQLYNLEHPEASRTVSFEERTDAEARGIVGATRDVFNNKVAAALTRLPGILAQNANLSQPEKEAHAAQELGRLHMSFNTWFNNQVNQSETPLSPKAVEQARQYWENQFAVIEKLTAGDLSNTKTIGAYLSSLKVKAGLDFHQSSPLISNVMDVFGPGAAGPIVQTAINVSTQGRTEMNNEILALTNGQATINAGTHMQNASNAAAGKTPIIKLPDYLQQKGALDVLRAANKDYISRPTSLTPQELKAYGNGQKNILAIALDPSRSASDKQNAVADVSSPQALATFKKFASNPDNAGDAQTIAIGNMMLNRQNVEAQVLSLKPEVAGIKMVDFKNLTSQAGYNFTPYYNPQTGRVEISSKVERDETTGTDNPAPSVTLVKQVQSINQSLNAIEQMKEYGTDQDKSLNGAQIKQVVALGSGLPLKPGTHAVEMPKTPESVQKKEANASGGNKKVNPFVSDMVAQVAQDHGVDPNIAQAFAWEESDMGRATNDAGIVGPGNLNPMQVHPDTAKKWGVNHLSVSGSIMGGVQEIKHLLDTYGGDVKTAAIGYIAGEGNIKSYLANPNKFPRTKTGVNRILKYLGIEDSQTQASNVPSRINVRVKG